MKKYYFAMAGVNCSHSKMFCKPFAKLREAKEALAQTLENNAYKVFSIERHTFNTNYGNEGTVKTLLTFTRS